MSIHRINKKTIGVVSVLISAFLWGFVGVFVRKMTDYGFSAIEMTAVRSFITWLILFLYLFFTDKTKLKIEKKDLGLMILIGIVSIMCFNILYFYTIQVTNVSAAAVLLYVWPVLVVLMSIVIFHESFTANKIIAAFLSLAGCVVVMKFWENGGIGALGLITGLASALTYATYSIFCVFALRKYQSLTILMYAFAVATLGCLPFVSFPGMIGLMTHNFPILITAVCQGIFTSALPYLFYTKGLRNLETGIAAILTSSVPMISTFVNAVAYGEAITAEQLIGSAIIILSIVILKIQVGGAKEEKE